MEKIFGIGLPRTGTRSLTKALQLLGYRAAHFLTIPAWINADFRNDELKNYDAVTDTPIPIYFPEFDRLYPSSKFILTTRDTASWLKSIERHQKEKLADSDHDNMRREYRLLTYGMYQFSEIRYKYVKETHDRNVAWYFRNRPSDLLILDISKGEGWKQLCSFLKKPVPSINYPNIS